MGRYKGEATSGDSGALIFEVTDDSAIVMSCSTSCYGERARQTPTGSALLIACNSFPNWVDFRYAPLAFVLLKLDPTGSVVLYPSNVRTHDFRNCCRYTRTLVSSPPAYINLLHL